MTVPVQTALTEDVPFLDIAGMHAELAAELDAAWRETLVSGSFVGGSALERFEHGWAAYCQVAHAVGVANGTDALVLALRALGVGPGDEVVLPANTFVATAEAVVLAGATPRFIDVDPRTLLVTVKDVEAAIGPRTAAVVAVHLYGQMPDLPALRAATSRAGVALVEDAAQAHGATWSGRRAGSFGDVACFSFYPGKNLGALGDGGAVVTDDAMLAARIRSMADHGRRIGEKYVHDVVGTNSRLDALQARLLSVKLRRLDDWNEARRHVVRRYAARLAGTPAQLVRTATEAESVHHLAVVQVPSRDAVQQRLLERGIATGIHYPVPCHRQLAFERWWREPLPVAEAAAGHLLSLPLSPTMTDAQVERVSDALLSSLDTGLPHQRALPSA